MMAFFKMTIWWQSTSSTTRKKIRDRHVIKRMANNCQESSLIAVIFTFLNFFAYPEIIPICIIIVLLSSLFLFIPLFNFINFSHNCFFDDPGCSVIFQNVPACIDGYPHVSVSRSVFVSATRKETTERREGNFKAEEKVIYETNTKRVVDHINFL